jgi:hypothetical protein
LNFRFELRSEVEDTSRSGARPPRAKAAPGRRTPRRDLYRVGDSVVSIEMFAGARITCW